MAIVELYKTTQVKEKTGWILFSAAVASFILYLVRNRANQRASGDKNSVYNRRPAKIVTKQKIFPDSALN